MCAAKCEREIVLRHGRCEGGGADNGVGKAWTPAAIVAVGISGTGEVEDRGRGVGSHDGGDKVDAFTATGSEKLDGVVLSESQS